MEIGEDEEEVESASLGGHEALRWGIVNTMCGVAYDKNGCGSNPLQSLRTKFSRKKEIDVNR